MKLITVFLALLSIGLFNTTSNAQSFITNGLVAYYPFNGNANDYAGTNNGIIHGGVALAPDRFGSNNSAYIFNGMDGYIDIGNPIGNSPVYFTEVVWVKTISVQSAAGVPSLDAIITKRQSGTDGSSWATLGFLVADRPKVLEQ